jgi:hypothetical protein
MDGEMVQQPRRVGHPAGVRGSVLAAPGDLIRSIGLRRRGNRVEAGRR